MIVIYVINLIVELYKDETNFNYHLAHTYHSESLYRKKENKEENIQLIMSSH